MRSEEKSGLKHLEVSVCLDASNTFRVQPATRKRAEEIARMAQHVELSRDTNFQMEFAEAMIFPE